MELSIHGGRVAIAYSPAMLEVTGSHPTFGDISEIHISNRYSLQHGDTVSSMEGLEMVCVALQDNLPVMSVAITGKKLPCYQD